MKIALCSYHNPNFINTNIYREKALKELGHELIIVDDRQYVLPGRVRQRFECMQKWDLQRMNDGFVKEAKKIKPDIWMVIGGQSMLATTVKKIKELGVRVVLWTTDIPIDFDIVKEAAPFYDHIFCAGSEAIEVLKNEVTLKDLRLIPFGCDPDYHKPVQLTPEEVLKYQRDIVFVGSFYPNRAKILESLANFNIGIWGPYWNKVGDHSPLRTKIMEGKFNYDEWVKIYSAAKIVLIIHYQDGIVPSYQITPKLFEAMACGSFVLVDNQKDVKALFAGKSYLDFFENTNDLKEKIQYYLEHEDRRKKMAKEGRQDVIERHTFKNRIARMIKIIQEKE
ncbi:hypothetical protein MNBD_UNCLBAC01-2036 [hydrothermal vent metagenome]|uniref:Spore protein YkvP/CgeB glycosyl transferase-like domain-containing protein n=1 Tax=hydrothermal vent metagenome TaxID=652676 RepID=A0A3B1D7N1_9ZZZZ